MRSRHLLEDENLQINPFRARITTYFHNTLFSKCIPEKKKKTDYWLSCSRPKKSHVNRRLSFVNLPNICF